MRQLLLCFALSLSSATARADWLPARARAVSRSESASRDAPVVELAYGPRAYGGVGLEPALYAHRGAQGRFATGVSALLAFENRDPSSPLPEQPLWRDVAGAWLSFAWPETPAPGAVLEVAALVGHAGSSSADVSPDAYRPSDVPFGGGGWFVAPDVAVRLPVAADVALSSRIGDRVDANAGLDLVGADEASDFAADYLREGASQQFFAELILSWKYSAVVRPLLAIHGEAVVPHDDSAVARVLARGLAGVGFAGRNGVLTPFVSGEAGSGKGLFINRQELRLSLGVRLTLGGAP